MGLLLKKGITGIDSSEYASEEQIREYLKRFSYPYIPQTEKIEPPTPSNNYWRIPFVSNTNGYEFDLLINSSHWNLALVTKESKWMKLEFLPFKEDLYLQIRSVKDKGLPMIPSLLKRNLKDYDLSDLGNEEIKQIEYWNSLTVGDIVFNGYD